MTDYKWKAGDPYPFGDKAACALIRGQSKSAEQTIDEDECKCGYGVCFKCSARVMAMESDEPMGSVPSVSPAGFDQILELGRIRENAAGGKKADTGKPRYELVPQAALAEVVKVLTHGASKYGDFNYMLVEDERYIGAIGRHLAQHLGVSLEGEPVSEYDQHTGLLHLAHIACNALILLEKRLRRR